MHLQSGCDDPNGEFHRGGSVYAFPFRSDSEFMESALPALPTTDTETKIQGSPYRTMDA